MGLKSSLMADTTNKLLSKKSLLLRIVFLLSSMAITSAGRVREIAGFPLEIFYKGRLHGATDFFYPSKTYISTTTFFPYFHISRDEERLRSLTENTAEINVFPSASVPSVAVS